MTEAEARAQLERMVAHDVDPVLTAADVTELLKLARRVDAAGQPSGDPTWVPTWDLNAAAAAGWEWKAGRVAGTFDFGEDGQSFSRSQVVTHCMRMVRLYRRASRPVTLSVLPD